MFPVELKNINIEDISVETDVVKKIPEEIARDNCLIAFKAEKNELFIAISEAPNFTLIEELKFILRKELKFFKTSRKVILKLIDKYYCKQNLDYALKDIKLKEDTPELTVRSLQDKYKFQRSPVIKVANCIIDKAIDERASDLHIEPFENSTTIRMRIDGIMREYIKIPKSVYPLLCTRIKIMAELDIAEKRIPQDGKIKYVKQNLKYDLRVSTLPTIYGEKIVLRILYRDENIKDMTALGFSKESENKIKRMLCYDHGLLLAVGPTGSGKSTTLYSLINNVNKHEKNIVSIEDPVEYTVEGINQVNVNTKIGFNFAEGLRSILRQDPDVIMLGEIRDEETAHIAIRAAVTGHLVLSTLHTNNPLESVIRLQDMGVPEYFIEDALVGVISQRLVRKICIYCRSKYTPTPQEIKELNLPHNSYLYRGKGCSKCNHTGYRGRTVVYEIVSREDIIKQYSKNDRINFKNSIKKSNTFSLRQKCIKLIKSGITTYEELLRLGDEI